MRTFLARSDENSTRVQWLTAKTSEDMAAIARSTASLDASFMIRGARKLVSK
jgi:hypothetical protein